MSRPIQLPLSGVTFRLGSAELRMVPDIEGVAASKAGDIWSVRSGKWRKMKPAPNTGQPRRPYYRVSLRDRDRGNIKRWFRVHHLVALAWLGEPGPESNVVDHIDCDPANNRPENLRWLTPQQNRARQNMEDDDMEWIL